MRNVVTKQFNTTDGTRLAYRAWLPAMQPERAVVLFHRGHEHSGRWQGLVDRIDLPGFAFFAWDARGHGSSPGPRGHAPDFATLVRDADAFVRHVCTHHGVALENVIVLGHSVGAVIAATWVLNVAPPLRALVLGSPALRVRLYVPFAVPLLRLWSKLRPRATVKSYVKGRLLTHDPAEVLAYESDPQISRDIAVNVLLGLHDASTRLIADAGAITVPTLVLSSGADFVVDRKAQRRFFERLGALRSKWRSYPGFFHDTFHEQRCDLPIRETRRFILREFTTPSAVPYLGDADRRGAGFEAIRTLAQPLPWWSPRRWHWALSRAALVSLGRQSDGIRLGLERGFDSGAMLDYVYRDRPSGRTAIGRWLDRWYLATPGWRGIRERRSLLVDTLRDGLTQLRRQGLQQHVVDIASGPGRYLLETLADAERGSVTARLQDASDVHLDEARALANALDLEDVEFARSDAFDTVALAALQPRPTLAIVAGLFELYPDNAPLRRTLAGLAAAMPDGSRLLYTNQPWHPQLELIGRVLNRQRDGACWVMRCRSQAEIDQLVAGAGFVKERTVADTTGMFTVSVARRCQAGRGPVAVPQAA